MDFQILCRNQNLNNFLHLNFWLDSILILSPKFGDHLIELCFGIKSTFLKLNIGEEPFEDLDVTVDRDVEIIPLCHILQRTLKVLHVFHQHRKHAFKVFLLFPLFIVYVYHNEFLYFLLLDLIYKGVLRVIFGLAILCFLG